MSEDYYSRLLPFILVFSQEFLALRNIHGIEAAFFLDNIFKRFYGFSALEAAGFHLKGGETIG